MRKLKFFAAAIFSAVVIAAAAFLYFKYVDNVIFCASAEIYTGRLPPDQYGAIEFSRKYELANYGFTPIEFKHFAASCGCTNVTLPKYLKPFSKVELVADVNYSAAELDGKNVSIAVQSTAKNGNITLKLHSEPANYFSCAPSRINFGGVYESSAVKREISVFVTTETDVEPTLEATEMPDEIKASIEQSNQREISYSDGSKSKVTKFKVYIELTADGGQITRSGAIKMKLHGDEAYDLSIPTQWAVLPAASFSQNSYIYTGAHDILPIVFSFDPSSKKSGVASVSGEDFRIKDVNENADSGEILLEHVGDKSKESSAEVHVKFFDGYNIKARVKYAP